MNHPSVEDCLLYFNEPQVLLDRFSDSKPVEGRGTSSTPLAPCRSPCIHCLPSLLSASNSSAVGTVPVSYQWKMNNYEMTQVEVWVGLFTLATSSMS